MFNKIIKVVFENRVEYLCKDIKDKWNNRKAK